MRLKGVGGMNKKKKKTESTDGETEKIPIRVIVVIIITEWWQGGGKKKETTNQIYECKKIKTLKETQLPATFEKEGTIFYTQKKTHTQ